MNRSQLWSRVRKMMRQALKDTSPKRPAVPPQSPQRASTRFGVSYSVFDGEELLEKSLQQIRPSVDYVNAVYSSRSFYGDAGDANVRVLLDSLKSRGLLDEVITFENEPVDAELPREVRGPQRLAAEIAKRNVGLDAARRAGCEWFMSMDTDEFYEPVAFARAQELLVASEWTHSFVHILNYGREPTRRYDQRKWEYYVPFFARLTETGRLGMNDAAPCQVDPSRCLEHGSGARYRVLSDIFMHHFTRVRRDLDGKYRNRKVTNAVDADWIDNDEGFIDVPDYFGLVDWPPSLRAQVKRLLRSR